MRPYIPLLGFSLALFAALGGCSRQPQNAPFRDTSTSRSDLAGVWKVAPQSLGLIGRYSSSVATNIAFDLQLDGKVLATNVPLDLGTNASSLNLASGMGVWEVDQKYAAFQVRITLQGHGQPLDVREFKGKPILTLTLGDPDSGEVIVFSR